MGSNPSAGFIGEASMQIYLLTRSQGNGECSVIHHRSLHRSLRGAKDTSPVIDDIWQDSLLEDVLCEARVGHFGMTVWEIRQLELAD